MLTLITGVPGSGKSLYAVHLIMKFIAERDQLIKKAESTDDPEEKKRTLSLVRNIYVDIDGFDHERFGTQVTPEDWRTTPDGSICFYDECQQKFGPDGGGRSKNPIIQDFEIHRHTGHDIFFITQRERLLHPNIRDLVGRHYHIQRVFGSNNVKVFRRDETINTTSTAALKQCDLVPWRYDKKLYNCYKSATVHTHKVKLPLWLKVASSAIVLLITFAGYTGYKSLSFFTGATASEIPVSASPVTQASPVQYQSEPLLLDVQKPNHHLMGCAVWSNGEQCQCYNVNGYTVDLAYSECMRWARGSTLSFRPQNVSRDRVSDP